MDSATLTTPLRIIRSETKVIVTPAKVLNPTKTVKDSSTSKSVSKVKAGLNLTDAKVTKKAHQKSLKDLISEGNLKSKSKASFSIFKGGYELSLREVIHGWWC